MAATARLNHDLIAKYLKESYTAKDPLQMLRAQCLSRGVSGIKGLSRTFRIFDDDDSKSLDLSEFRKGLHDYGVDMDSNAIADLFHQLDFNKDGVIDFNEFLVSLRPPMPSCRRALIIKAFKKLDRTGDGVVTVEDLKGVYSVKHHPRYISGDWNEEKCLEEFLVSFDTPNEVDSQITEEEFISYYAAVSACIDNDAYFDLMMRNAWKL